MDLYTSVAPEVYFMSYYILLRYSKIVTDNTALVYRDGLISTFAANLTALLCLRDDQQSFRFLMLYSAACIGLTAAGRADEALKRNMN